MRCVSQYDMGNYDKEVIASAMEHSAGLPTAMQSAFIEGVKYVLNRYMVSLVSIPSVRIAGKPTGSMDMGKAKHTSSIYDAYLAECRERGVEEDADGWVRWLWGYEDF